MIGGCWGHSACHQHHSTDKHMEMTTTHTLSPTLSIIWTHWGLKISNILQATFSTTHRRQDTVWTNDDAVHWHYMASLGLCKLAIIGSDNGLSTGLRQTIIWTGAVILSIWTLGTKLSEMLIGIHMFSFKKSYLNMSSAKVRRLCLNINVLPYTGIQNILTTRFHFMCEWGLHTQMSC